MSHRKRVRRWHNREARKREIVNAYADSMSGAIAYAFTVEAGMTPTQLIGHGIGMLLEGMLQMQT